MKTSAMATTSRGAIRFMRLRSRARGAPGGRRACCGPGQTPAGPLRASRGRAAGSDVAFELHDRALQLRDADAGLVGAIVLAAGELAAQQGAGGVGPMPQP